MEFVVRSNQAYHIYTHANGSENLLVRVKNEAALKACFNSKSKKDLTRLEGEYRQDLSGLERLTMLHFGHLFNAYTKANNVIQPKRTPAEQQAMATLATWSSSSNFIKAVGCQAWG